MTAPNVGLGTWPARRARIDADAVALRQGERTLTYGELAARVERCAALLASLGVGKGDRVGYLGVNDLTTFEVFFATTRLGALFAPFNWRLTPHEIAALTKDCSPRVLVHDAAFDPGRQVAHTLVVGDGYEAALAAAPTHAPPVGVDLDDDAVLLYTSGTTGRSKGAVLTHANLTFNTMNQLAHADVLSTDVAMCMCPLFHATGLGQVSLPTLFKGGTVVVVARFEPATVLRTIADLGIASFSAVPTMLQVLCDHPDFATTDLSSLRYVIYGGSAVSERVAVAWHDRGVPVLQGYGMTEASPGTHLAPMRGAAERPTSVGVPHFFTDVTFDPGEDATAAGTSGELLVRGPNVFRGYWQRPEDTAAAMTDGWYHSGDVVSVAPDGWAYVVDRIKDLIISGGENVYPSEVEAAINALPGIVDCAVVAVADERWGEVGAAFVVPAAAGQWTEADLLSALEDRLARFKIPRSVRFVDDLPRTATGKVRKRELRG